MANASPVSSESARDPLPLLDQAALLLRRAQSFDEVLTTTARLAQGGPVLAAVIYLREEPTAEDAPPRGVESWAPRAAAPPPAALSVDAPPKAVVAAAAETPLTWPDVPVAGAYWMLLPLVSGAVHGVLALQVDALLPPAEIVPYRLLAALAAAAAELLLLRPQVRRNQAELRLLDKIAEVVNSSVSLDAILTQSLALLSTVIPFDGGSIALINAAHELAIQAIYGEIDASAREMRMPVGTGIAGWVAANRQPYLSNDLDNERTVPPAMRFVGTNRRLNAYMAAPLVVEGRVLGVLQVNSPRRNVFSARDLALLAEVADRCAGAVERARLFAALQTRADRLASLAEIARHISAAQDLAELFETCYAQVRKVMAADAFLVALYDAPAGLVRYEFIRDNAQVYPKYAKPLDKGVTSYVIRTAQPLMVAARAELPTVPVPVGLDEPVPEALLMVPLVFEDHVLGAMSTQSYTPGAYTDDDLALLATIANQAAVAVRNMQLLHSERAAQQVRDEFVSMVSHELRTPLTAIKGTAQVMQRRMLRALSAGNPAAPADQEVRKRDVRQLSIIVTQAERLNALVDDLLDLSRMQGGRFRYRPKAADLTAVVRQAVEAGRALGSGHTLTVEAPDTLPGVFDPLRIAQVLTNLITNAIKYSPVGSEVRIIVQQPEADLALVQVHDKGPGLPQEEQERLFERFYRGTAGRRNPSTGLGLGLYISRQIVEWHGGRIWIASTPGTGNTFQFALPLARP